MVELGPVLEAPALVGAGPRAPGLPGGLLAVLVAILALAPWAPPLPVGEALAAAGVGLLALAAGALGLAGHLPLPIATRRLLPAILGFAPLALIATSQALLPVPEGWAPLFDEAGAALPGAGIVPRLSFDPPATLAAALRLLGTGGAFWLSLQLGRAGSRARQAFAALLGLAALEAAAFLAGLHPAPTLAGIGLAAGLALLFDRMAEGGESGRGFGPALSHFLQRLSTKGLPFLAGILVLGAALVLDRSRSAAAPLGAMVALVGLLAAPSLGILRRKGLLALWLVLFAAALVLGAVAMHQAAGAGAAAGREAALYAVLDHPWAGVGLGAVEPALRLYREAHLAAPGTLPGPLALALGAGLPAAAGLLVALCFLFGRAAFGLWARRRNAAFPAAALGATVMVSVPAAPDFATLLAWAVVLGIGTAHSFRTREG